MSLCPGSLFHTDNDQLRRHRRQLNKSNLLEYKVHCCELILTSTSEAHLREPWRVTSVTSSYVVYYHVWFCHGNTRDSPSVVYIEIFALKNFIMYLYLWKDRVTPHRHPKYSLKDNDFAMFKLEEFWLCQKFMNNFYVPQVKIIAFISRSTEIHDCWGCIRFLIS